MRLTLTYVCAPLTLLGIVAAAPAPAAPRVFRAGAATSVITPPLGISINGGMRDRRATHIHDELHARCLVIDNGDVRLAIVACDSCVIPRHLFDEAKALTAARTRIRPDRLLLCATHTHTAPTAAPVFQSEPDDAYLRLFARRIADGITRAESNLAPARIGWTTAASPEHVFNRRWRKKDGTIPADPFGGRTDQVQMNPPRGSADLLEPVGPTDPTISIVSVTSPAGKPIALLANYSLHYVGGTGPGDISADYFGMFADRVGELLGTDRHDPPFVAMLTNGTSADINNINFRQKGTRKAPYEQMRLVAHDVAARTVAAVSSMTYHTWAPMDMRQSSLHCGVRLPTSEDVGRARAVLAQAKGPVLQTRPEIYARETVFLSEYPPKVELLLQALRIGDLAIVTLPCEVFVEIGLDLRKRSPFAHTFTIQLANGYNGYLPTVRQHTLGGYETWRARSSYLAADAAPAITARLLEHLKELYSGS